MRRAVRMEEDHRHRLLKKRTVIFMSSIIPEEKWRMTSKLKQDYESDQYSSVRKDFGVDRKLRLRAIDRRQNHSEPRLIDAIRVHVLIRCPGSQSFAL